MDEKLKEALDGALDKGMAAATSSDTDKSRSDFKAAFLASLTASGFKVVPVEPTENAPKSFCALLTTGVCDGQARLTAALAGKERELGDVKAQLYQEINKSAVYFKSADFYERAAQGQLARAECAEARLAKACEALEKAKSDLICLANAASRLSVAAQTTGGVAGLDEGLCAEIDRSAHPIGKARVTIAAIDATLQEIENNAD